MGLCRNYIRPAGIYGEFPPIRQNSLEKMESEMKPRIA